jgi:acetoin utilization deacetylase AcuC-like enzyme
MSVALFTHPAMLRHGVPPGHPERPERLASVLAALEDFDLERLEAPEATREHIARVHPEVYLDAIEAAFPAPGEDLVAIDGDTFLTDGTREAALRAAGAVVAAVDHVRAGRSQTAFCAVRPPGHHAEPAQSRGFCIFNNVAVGALHALEAHGLSRVAVVDFDVHHGNGTQATAMKDGRLFFASTHQSPLYPGTGRADERGPADNVVNAPLPPGADGAAWRRAMERTVLPALDAFAPELILVSAGFDAHKADPLANMALVEQDYAWAAQALRSVARAQCKGHVVSTLEGGYDLSALGKSAAAFVRALDGG